MGLIFRQLHISFYHIVIFQWSFVCLFYVVPVFVRMEDWGGRECVYLCLCVQASEGVFTWPTLTYLFIVPHFLTVIFFLFFLPFHTLYMVQVISLSASLFFTFQKGP